MKFTNPTTLLLFLLPAVSSVAAQNNNAAANVDPQVSLTLDPSVICTGCEQDGQNPPVAGQKASLTSNNNFINFCVGKTLTNGLQVAGGSCNAVPMGQIIPSTSMPSSKISFPVNGGSFPADTAFTFTMNVQNMNLGNFVNAQKNYFGAPQQVVNGIVKAHSHVTVQLIPAIDTTAIPNSVDFAFFKGLNDPDVNGVLSAAVAKGLPAGAYRFCSMNTAANHQPVNVAIAQHGSLDDCIYATAVAAGAVAANNTADAGANVAANNTVAAGNAAANNTVDAGNAAANNTVAAGNNAAANNTVAAGNNAAANNTANVVNNAANNTANTGANNAANTGANQGGKNRGKGRNGRNRNGRNRNNRNRNGRGRVSRQQ